MTWDGKQPRVKDNHGLEMTLTRKTTLEGKQPWMKEMTLIGKQPWIKEDLRLGWKTTLDGRRP